MKAFALILFSTLLFPVFGQVDNDPRLVERFDPRLDCEALEGGLDRLFAEASNDSPSMAYVVIHQSGNAFDNAIVHRKMIRYVIYRGFPLDRFTVLMTKGNGDIKVETWISRNGKAPSLVSSDLDIVIRGRRPRIRFAEDTIETVRIDGRDTYMGSGNPSCLYGFSPYVVWELLKANPGFDAEFSIKTRSSRRYGKLVAILNKDFLADGAPPGRFRFVYGGPDRELKGSPDTLATVITSLVKRGRN